MKKIKPVINYRKSALWNKACCVKCQFSFSDGKTLRCDKQPYVTTQSHAEWCFRKAVKGSYVCDEFVPIPAVPGGAA
jgi:hypothetical protein